MELISVPTTHTGNRDSVGVYFIEQNPSGRIQLFEEVKVDNVAGQDRASDRYRLCYVRGPEGIIVELAEQIG